MAEEPYEPKLPTAPNFSSNVTDEQRDTAQLLEQVLGKSVSDRYLDFCTLSAGVLPLRVSSPMAAHALRELESIFRNTLEGLAGVKPSISAIDIAITRATESALRALSHDEDAIGRAIHALAPHQSHKAAIKKIVAWLGLDEQGDISKAWLALTGAQKKAHERKFNRTLRVDDEFRNQWAKPFDMVVRGVAVALQGKYSALIRRAEELAKMADAEKSLTLFEKEIPGAISVQWHFYTSISGPGWLPELINRGLTAEPPEIVQNTSRDWPVGQYLLHLAKDGDAKTRHLVAVTLRGLASAQHPEVRRVGLQIIASMPPDEAANLADVAAGWLGTETHFLGTNNAEAITLALLTSGHVAEGISLATALLRVFDNEGRIGSLYSQHMYEHSLPKLERTLTEKAGIKGLKLLVSLLEEAAIFDGKVGTDPDHDYTSIASGRLTEDDSARYDIFGALVAAVRLSAESLIENPEIDGEEIISVLLNKPYKIMQRLAMHTLSKRPQAAPEIADTILLNPELLDSYSHKFEYGELAAARFPHMGDDKKRDLLSLVDKAPDRYLEIWKNRFEESAKREPTPDEVRNYRNLTIRDLTFYWRKALPQDRQHNLEKTIKEFGEPDAWKDNMDSREESPLYAKDFASLSVSDVITFLRDWQPNQKPAKHTVTALASELRNAVSLDPTQYSAVATEFGELKSVYIRRLLEGLRQPVQNGGMLHWGPVLALIEKLLPDVQPITKPETSFEGDDPSLFWTAKEAAELVRNGLQQGNSSITLESDATLQRILKEFERISPRSPQFEHFEERYAENPFFAAGTTMYGLTAELNVLYVFWLSKHEGSATYNAPTNSLALLPGFQGFASRALSQDGDNGKIARAVFGRYLNWLLYFGEGWVRANFTKLFPSDDDLAEATWLGHLLSDNFPAKLLMAEMEPLYSREILRLADLKPDGEREYRRNRLAEYLAVLYLWGVLPESLLRQFLEAASPALRRHVMWFVGKEINQSKDMPAEIRARGFEYWERRLSAGESDTQKDPYREELGVVGFWVMSNALGTKWLIGQLTRVLKAGYVPGHEFMIVEWASKLGHEYINEVIEMVDLLISNPRTDRWAYMTQHDILRSILVAGIASGHQATVDRVQHTISYLASQGETSFTDLSR